MKAALYARVSTRNHGQDVQVQTRDLEQFAEARGWQLIDSYLDSGICGAKDRRPELELPHHDDIKAPPMSCAKVLEVSSKNRKHGVMSERGDFMWDGVSAWWNVSYSRARAGSSKNLGFFDRNTENSRPYLLYD
jgi:hypothetical protein